jgi:alpha-aminoadipic semialdehyde synthase
MNCIYWDTPYPRIVTKAAAAELFSEEKKPRLKVIGDVTCDIDGSIEFTEKATEPDQPAYVYEPETGSILDGVKGRGPVVMAVDNLPCELPKESSETFSRALKPFLKAMAEADYETSFEELRLPEPIKRGLILHKGAFTPDYTYMNEFLAS